MAEADLEITLTEDSIGEQKYDNIPAGVVPDKRYFTTASQLHKMKLALLELCARSLGGGVDSAFDWKASVKVATTANITLSGAQTIDGVSAGVGARVLVKDQSTASQNGLYVVASGAWTRATDADADAEVTAGLACYVEQGSTNGGKIFLLTTTGPISLGSTSLTFAALSTGLTWADIVTAAAAADTAIDFNGQDLSSIAQATLTGLDVEGFSALNGNVSAAATISPAQITADQADYTPTGIDSCFAVRLDLDADRALKSLHTTGDGQLLLLINTSAFVLTLKHEFTSGTTASQRFHCPDGVDYPVAGGASALLWWDATTQRWRIIASGGGLAARLAALTGDVVIGSGAGTITLGSLFSVAEGLGDIYANASIDMQGNTVLSEGPGASPLVSTTNATAFTLDDGYHGQLVRFTHTGLVTVTVDGALTPGLRVEFMVDHATGSVTFTGSGGLTIRQADGLYTATRRYAVVSVTVLDSSNAVLVGDLDS